MAGHSKSDNKAIKVQLTLTGTRTELGKIGEFFTILVKILHNSSSVQQNAHSTYQH